MCCLDLPYSTQLLTGGRACVTTTRWWGIGHPGMDECLPSIAQFKERQEVRRLKWDWWYSANGSDDIQQTWYSACLRSLHMNRASWKEVHLHFNSMIFRKKNILNNWKAVCLFPDGAYSWAKIVLFLWVGPWCKSFKKAIVAEKDSSLFFLLSSLWKNFM